MTAKNINNQIIKELTARAKKQGWIFTFDKDEDVLFYSPEIIPDKAKLHSVNDEFSVYLDKKSNICGVVLEYCGHNFIKHHDEFTGYFKKLFSGGSKEDEKILDPNKTKNTEVKSFTALFERTLISEAAGAKIH